MTAPRPPKPARKKPEAKTPAANGAPKEKAGLHPRNRHQGRYDFPALIKSTPELAKFVIINPYGKESIDFASPEAVRVFNRALLKAFYGIAHWDIPPITCAHRCRGVRTTYTFSPTCWPAITTA